MGSRFAAFSAALIAAASCADAEELPPGTLLVDVAEIVDSMGFGRPMVAARVLVPSGWRTQGGVQWANGPCQEVTTLAWSAVAPDGSAGIEFQPAETWSAGTSGSQGCIPANHRTIRAYLEAYVRGRVPGARVLDYRARPDVLELNRAYYDGIVQMVAQSGIGARAYPDAGEILYAFQQNGAEMRAVALAAGMFYVTEQPNPFGGPPLWNVTGGTHGVFGAFAPNGQLDFAAVDAIRKSIKYDPAWAAEVFKTKLAIDEQNVQGVRDRAAIIVAGGAAMTRATIEANRIAARNYADISISSSGSTSSSSSSTDATDERIQRERIEAIRGVETYHDPLEGGTVQLDATYDHAWRVSNQQAYILTNDPNFNPGLYNIDAQQLQVVQ